MRLFKLVLVVLVGFLFAGPSALATDCDTDCDEKCTTEVWDFLSRAYEEVVDPFCLTRCFSEKQLDCATNRNGCAIWKTNVHYYHLIAAIKLARREGHIKDEDTCRRMAEDAGTFGVELMRYFKHETLGIGEVTTHMGKCACSGIDWPKGDDAVVPDDKVKWNRMPGAAIDIGAGGGRVWAIGTDKGVGGFGNSVYFWTGIDWIKTSGEGLKIAVDPLGYPWVVNNKDEIWRLDKNQKKYVKLPGTARDIAISSRGDVWIVGTDKNQFGFGIYRWDGDWKKVVAAAGTAVAVSPKGLSYVVNNLGEIWRDLGTGRYEKVPDAFGSDISIGANGIVWVIGKDQNKYGHQIWASENGKNYSSRNGFGTTVTNAKNGDTWISNAKNQIWMKRE